MRVVLPTIEIPTTHAPWGGATGFADIHIQPYDWHAATFVMAFSLSKGGAAAITLTNAAAGSQGVSATYDSSLADPNTGVVVGGTIIRPQIDEATLEALSWGANDPTEPLPLFMDLLVTPSGSPQQYALEAPVLLYKGIAD